MSFACGFAAVLCGLTGIAGGTVLGPLFLKYNMIPMIMGSTNQYITLISATSVIMQFIIAGTLNWMYAGLSGILTMIAAYIGITQVNAYVQKTGKQSMIAVLLAAVLIFAFLSTLG